MIKKWKILISILPTFEELDRKFTLQELRHAIFSQLQFHKASGPDGIHNGVLKWGMEWFEESFRSIKTSCGKKKKSVASQLE